MPHATYTKGFIEACLGKLSGQIDIDNLYEVAAFLFLLDIRCTLCQAPVDFDSLGSDVGSITWCKAAAQHLEHSKWKFPPQQSTEVLVWI